MRKDAVPVELSSVAFEFFFWFSRFEFCLKEFGYLKDEKPGSLAAPNWEKFVTKYASSYHLSDEARELAENPPERQVVQAGLILEWRPVGTIDCTSELAKVVRLVKTVRNNLFHGGKHGARGWDNPTRAQSLLTSSNIVLAQLAALAGFQEEYERTY